ncbi:MAG: orotate phosphoribosyltransferase [Microgenomates group bacterium]
MKTKEKLMLSLFQIGAIKFGSFKLKSGMLSPVYIDLRVLVSYPKILKLVAKEYLKILEKLKFNRMAAVPYTAIPIVCAISLINNKPWIYTRKEVKDYGTKKAFEGEYKKGEKVVLVDDMVTTGDSKIEAIAPLVEAGLIIKDIVVLFDRQQGARQFLEKKGLRLHFAFTLKEWLDFLYKAKKIEGEKYEEIVKFLGYKSVKV